MEGNRDLNLSKFCVFPFKSYERKMGMAKKEKSTYKLIKKGRKITITIRRKKK